jgi:chitinase
MPLAAHATNREQSLPASFTGYTAKSHSSPALASTPVTEPAPTIAPKGRSTRANIQRTAPIKNAKDVVNAQMVAAPNSKQSNSVVSRALKAVGTPYRWGGSTPGKGLDCSGLVKYAFGDVSEVNLPRTSNAMAEGHGQKVDRKDLKPGDLLFFNIKSRRVNHVAIYLGNDRFVHAPRRGKAVTVDTLKKPYWDSHYMVAKRVLPKQKAPLRIVQR